MLKVVACLLVLAMAIGGQSANGLAQLRTRRAPAPAALPATEDKPEMVLAEIKSEADEIGEDGSNDESASEDSENGRQSAPEMVEAELLPAPTELAETTAAVEPAAESLHDHFRRYTKPMELLPTHSLAEVRSDASIEAAGEAAAEADSSVRVGADDDADGEGKGSNPTYILPVDPFNYFPFFNGFSNVNPFSQFYPPPPYLYPQYTNYMHRYANHGIGHPPAYPHPGAYGGAFGHHAYGHGSFPYNYPHPNPHMHYPFGAYKLDVSGPDVRTGSNSPPPFPQFSEVSARLITPELIPKSEADADAEEEEEQAPITAQLEMSATEKDDSGDENEMTNEVEFEEEADEGDGMTDAVEFEDESSDEDGMTEDVEFADEADQADQLTDVVEFEEDQEDTSSRQDEEGNTFNADDVEYQG